MNELSTENAGKMHFEPHGKITISVLEDGIVLYRPEGPFNIELVKAYAKVEAPALAEFRTKYTKWCEVGVYEKSCLATDEAMEALKTYLVESRKEGRVIAGSAHVFLEGVEGHLLMPPKYKKCVEAAGVKFKSFTNEADAIAWARKVYKESL